MAANFLATLGQRPEAITMAIDILDARYRYTTLGVLHTHPHQSDIAESYHQLLHVLEKDYPHHQVVTHEMTQLDGSPLLDITDSLTADAYYTGVVTVLRDYRVQYQPVHLLIAGGRKSMSVYATLAAALLFGEYDHVWTILTEPRLMQVGLFHLPVGAADGVTIVEMPLPISRLIPCEIARQSVGQLTQRSSPRQKFLLSLTPSELKLAEWVRQQPSPMKNSVGCCISR
jgi:CRISPR-associated protein (TIGR02584 family)